MLLCKGIRHGGPGQLKHWTKKCPPHMKCAMAQAMGNAWARSFGCSRQCPTLSSPGTNPKPPPHCKILLLVGRRCIQGDAPQSMLAFPKPFMPKWIHPLCTVKQKKILCRMSVMASGVQLSPKKKCHKIRTNKEHQWAGESVYNGKGEPALF